MIRLCLFIGMVHSGGLSCSEWPFCKFYNIFYSIFLKSTSWDVLRLCNSLIYRLYTDFELKGRRKAKQGLNMASVHVFSTLVSHLFKNTCPCLSGISVTGLPERMCIIMSMEPARTLPGRLGMGVGEERGEVWVRPEITTRPKKD